MNSKPLVSVGMPVRNGAPLLRRAVGSILSQSYPNIELIISDNASTDETDAIVAEFSSKDARIRATRQQSPISAFENGLKVLDEARGRYFLWAAHDDTRNPQFIELLLAALEQDSGSVLAFGSCFVEKDDLVTTRPLAFDFDTTHMAPVSRIWKTSQRQCFHIYGLWRADVLRSMSFTYTNWWPDLPIMVSAATQGSFRHVAGAEFTYHEVIKTAQERAAYQDPDESGSFSYFQAVGSLVRAAWTTTRSNATLSLSAVAAFCVAISQIKRVPGFAYRKMRLRFRRDES